MGAKKHSPKVYTLWNLGWASSASCIAVPQLRNLEAAREGGADAELICYTRPHEVGPKASDYLLAPTGGPTGLHLALTSAWGQWSTVRKRREIFLNHKVCIFLDVVEQLGCFLELEAVLEPNREVQQGYKQLAELQQRFGITAADCVEGSYSDLLAQQSEVT